MIVDDEPLSIKVVERYLNDLPQLELIASCNDAFAAMNVLRAQEIDLIFLDINMPKLSGISFLKTMVIIPLASPKSFTCQFPVA